MDLLGRDQVATDLDGSSRCSAGAGSSSPAPAARSAPRSPARWPAAARQSLLLLDHDETHLHDVAATTSTATAVQVLADIREPDRRAAGVRPHRPEVVFHAAAHKHVPLLEDHPCEAVTTNVLGTPNRRRRGPAPSASSASCSSRPTRPCAPSSVMGASKRARRAARPAAGARRTRASAPSASATCSAAAAASSRPSCARSGRRAGHGHRRPHDPLLHEHPRGGAARAAGGGAGRRAARCSCSTWASRCASSTSPSA